MIIGFLVLLAFQLLGELIVLLLGLPVPGAVLGMLLLLIALALKGEVPAGVRQAGEGLLSVLPLFLVPAGVGLMLHFELIAKSWLSILIALLVSTFLAMLVVALVMKLSSLDEYQGEDHDA